MKSHVLVLDMGMECRLRVEDLRYVNIEYQSPFDSGDGVIAESWMMDIS